MLLLEAKSVWGGELLLSPGPGFDGQYDLNK